MEKIRGENKSDIVIPPARVRDNSKSKTVYNPILLVEKISPLGIKWYIHNDEPYILETLTDGQKHTPTGIVRLIGKRYGRTCYKETVKSILFIWHKRGLIGHETVGRYGLFWLENNSPHGESVYDKNH